MQKLSERNTFEQERQYVPNYYDVNELKLELSSEKNQGNTLNK